MKRRNKREERVLENESDSQEEMRKKTDRGREEGRGVKIKKTRRIRNTIVK